jgi:hypothetical protein
LVTYHVAGRTKDAGALEEKVQEAHRSILGDDHLAALMSVSQVALTYGTLVGQPKDMAGLQEKVLDAQRRILGINPLQLSAKILSQFPKENGKRLLLFAVITSGNTRSH